jgi:hypothetical protein
VSRTVPIVWRSEGDVQSATNSEGQPLYELSQDASGSRRLWATLPDQRRIEVLLGRGVHPIIGPCDAVRVVGEEDVRAFCGQTDWQRPTHIPALDRPGALPHGGGAALLNTLAVQAQHAGVAALRYRGPYPTTMLFDSLLASFRVVGDLEEARVRFCEDAEDTALGGAMAEPTQDFIPHPHVWSWPDPRICVQRRDAVMRVWIDGHAFERDATVGRSVEVESSGDLRVSIALAGTTVLEVGRLDPDGRPKGPLQLELAAPADLIGKPLPDEVVAVLAEILAAQGSHLLAPAVQAVVRPGRVRWGDPGIDLVEVDADGVVVHAGLVEHLPTQSQPLLAAILALVGWPVRQLAQRHLSDAAEAILRR